MQTSTKTGVVQAIGFLHYAAAAAAAPTMPIEYTERNELQGDTIGYLYGDATQLIREVITAALWLEVWG
jgi:hypothetical protein